MGGGLQVLIDVLHRGTNDSQSKAAAAIAMLTVNEENCNVILANGGMKALFKIMCESSAELATAAAAGSLRNLAMIGQTQGNLIRSDIQVFISVLRDGGQHMEAAAAALWNLSQNRENQAVIREEGGIQPLIKLLNDSTASSLSEEAAAGSLRSLAEDESNRKVIRHEGGVGSLMKVLHGSASAEARAEAQAALQIFGLESEKDREQQLIDAGGQMARHRGMETVSAHLGLLAALGGFLAALGGLLSSRPQDCAWRLSGEVFDIEKDGIDVCWTSGGADYPGVAR